MITEEQGRTFAHEWINAWNAHDIKAILSHYTDELDYYSPLIATLKFNEAGNIKSKAELEKYFAIGLKAYPDLKFQLHNFFTGVNTVVLYYTSVNNRLVTEVFQLNDKGLAEKVFCNYGQPKSQ